VYEQNLSFVVIVLPSIYVSNKETRVPSSPGKVVYDRLIDLTMDIEFSSMDKK